ncbi:PREDICTED: mavicyanin-like [Tarenaya hassleriana]|uniref:mavicyanin-like n=1 Tax=Tarenaya hassleriana TaxID=28532 RepID=UPI00053C3676|nr:PREDICTED: mavicyanin-like [Tarenaya hassleriana]
MAILVFGYTVLLRSVRARPVVKNAMCFKESPKAIIHVLTTIIGCVGTTHKIEGWAPGVDYYTWVTSRHFQVGDSLVFEYNKDFHDVTEVASPLAFEFCDLSSTIARYKTGYDVVNLTRPGRYYYVCGAPGHCQAGQRFDILVTSPQVVEKSPSSFSPSPSAPLHSAASSSLFSRLGLIFLFLVLLPLFLV